jgi:hypothetical protein
LATPATSANPESRISLSVVVFVTVGTILARLCFYAAGIILLIWTYGRDRVLREHLSIMKYKPQIIVSNGDVLLGQRNLATSIGALMWLVSTFVCLLLVQRLLPRSERDALRRKHTAVSTPALLVVIALFFGIGLLPLLQSVLVAGSVLAIAFLLSWRRTRAEPQG